MLSKTKNTEIASHKHTFRAKPLEPYPNYIRNSGTAGFVSGVKLNQRIK
jgi:hypothetical protein